MDYRNTTWIGSVMLFMNNFLPENKFKDLLKIPFRRLNSNLRIDQINKIVRR